MENRADPDFSDAIPSPFSRCRRFSHRLASRFETRDAGASIEISPSRDSERIGENRTVLSLSLSLEHCSPSPASGFPIHRTIALKRRRANYFWRKVRFDRFHADHVSLSSASSKWSREGQARRNGTRRFTSRETRGRTCNVPIMQRPESNYINCGGRLITCVSPTACRYGGS